MDANDKAELLRRKPIIHPDWPASKNHGGGSIAGAVSDEDILALWGDEERYLAGARFFRYGQPAAGAWLSMAAEWAGLARAAGPRPALTVFVPEDALTGDYYQQSGRQLTEKELADLLWAPENCRSAKVVASLSEKVGKEGSLDVQWAKEVMSLYGFARRNFETTERKAMMAAFAAGSLDVAAAMASDLLASEHHNAQVPPEEQEAFFAMPLSKRAQRWMTAELAQEARRQGTAHAQTVWTVAMARAWVEQDPAVAKEHIEKAIADASELWEWADAPKKSAPGELTANERSFAGLVKRVVDIAVISGAQLPQRVNLAQEAIVSRQAQNKAGVGKSKKARGKAGLGKNAGQAGGAVIGGPAPDAASKPAGLSGAKSRVGEGTTEAPWSAEKLRNRQNVLLTALDGLDTEAVEWCLKDGGLAGEKLIFARGTARGGPIDSLCGFENWKSNQKLATHLLKLLEGAGLNFALECKAPGGRQVGNPFIRGAQLTELHGPENGQELMTALALAQVRSCAALKMDMEDIAAWVKEALNSSQIERIRKYGSGGLNCDAYFQAVKAAIEQVQLGAVVRDAAEPGAKLGRAGIEKADDTPPPKRRTGRL